MMVLSILAIFTLFILLLEKMPLVSCIVLCMVLIIAPITYFNEVYKEIKG
nr:hypothetical protein [Methanobrevibacter arboriphilus]